MRLSPTRWLRDPVAWLVVLSLVGTVSIAGLLITTLEPGLDQMVAQAPVEKPMEDIGERLAEETPVPVPTAPAAQLPPPVTRVPTHAVRVAEEEPEPEPRDESEYEEPERSNEEDWQPRRARRTVEVSDRGLRRQIRELEHLRDALEREQRQIRRHAQQDSRWDPDGHHLRQMRLAQLDIEIARVERDISRLERGRPTLD
jgi:hypothetical protein